MTDWMDLARRASITSHRLVGWVYWDPVGIENYASLGVENGTGYYVATRAAPLGGAGNDVVAAAFYSIHPVFISMALDLCRAATTFEETAAARDSAVTAGLREYVPEICDDLAAFAEPMWEVVDALAGSGRVLFAAHRQWPRPSDSLLSAWLAVNCIREWRGDTHWALHIAEDLDGPMAGILDNAWRRYETDWIPRSRGADDDTLDAAYAELERRGLAANRVVNEDGVRLRQDLEDRLDHLTTAGWKSLGDERTRRFIEMVEPVGDRLMERIDATAGEKWMPAGRSRPDR